MRAIDDSGRRAPSLQKTLTFHVLATPQLSISVEAGQVRLNFESRADFTYDLQVSTDFAAWGPVTDRQFIAGTGGVIEMSDDLAERPRVFYRLVEYR